MDKENYDYYRQGVEDALDWITNTLEHPEIYMLCDLIPMFWKHKKEMNMAAEEETNETNDDLWLQGTIQLNLKTNELHIDAPHEIQDYIHLLKDQARMTEQMRKVESQNYINLLNIALKSLETIMNGDRLTPTGMMRAAERAVKEISTIVNQISTNSFDKEMDDHTDNPEAYLSRQEKIDIANKVTCGVEDKGGGFSHYKKRPLVLKARQMATAFSVETLEGTMKGQPGDWLVIGTKGELYPVADNIFKDIYIPAPQPSTTETNGS